MSFHELKFDFACVLLCCGVLSFACSRIRLMQFVWVHMKRFNVISQSFCFTNINVSLRPHPSFTFWSTCVFELDTPDQTIPKCIKTWTTKLQFAKHYLVKILIKANIRTISLQKVINPCPTMDTDCTRDDRDVASPDLLSPIPTANQSIIIQKKRFRKQ